MIVNSSDGVEVAVHDLAGHDVDHPVLLISHATGFHGHCYQPLAEALATRFHSIAFDFRGHGDTPQAAGVDVSWDRYTDDVEAVALSLTRPLSAFGHSMGGSCLLMAAHRHPDLFSQLMLFEPIVFEPDALSEDDSPPQLAEGARRRRPTFASFDAGVRQLRLQTPAQPVHPRGARCVRAPRLLRRRRWPGAPEVPAGIGGDDVRDEQAPRHLGSAPGDHDPGLRRMRRFRPGFAGTALAGRGRAPSERASTCRSRNSTISVR